MTTEARQEVAVQGLGAARKFKDRGKASHEQDGGIMSSSSDIEKLFDHFGGDANAYQEIGRENEARTARTRWPLLVTLDLTQPTIPEIGQRREAKPQPPVAAAAAVDRQDPMPKDVASVTRAKAPLFTRSPRRDIPPVVVAAPQPAAPSGASRFGVLGGDDESAGLAQAAAAINDRVAAQAGPTVPVPPTAPVTPATVSPQPAPSAFAVPVPPAAPTASPGLFAAIAAVPPAAPMSPAMPVAGVPSGSPFRMPLMPTAHALAAPAAQTLSTSASAVPSWTQAPPSTHPYASAPAGPAIAPAAPSTAAAFRQPAQPAQPPSILGKLFAARPPAAPQQSAAPAATSGEAVPLQSVFDRLRGAPAQSHAPTTAAAPAGATPGVPHSWLVNGPRRS